MKHSLLATATILFATVYGQAQHLAPREGGYNQDVHTEHAKYKKGNTGSRVNIVSDWYNYGDAIYDAGGDVSYFRNFLFPDSTVLVDFSDGVGPVWKHSLGEVLDPSSPLFVSNGQTATEPHIPYTLDSIAIPYRYWRFQDANPDTLVVQVYKEPAINLQLNPGWTSGASYSNVPYDYQERIGDSETLTFKYLLTNDDTTADGTQKVLEFATNLSIPAGQKVAVTATYFPGNAYNVNDTIDTYATFSIDHRINAFVFYDYRDNDILSEPGVYNNELCAPTDVRYNINTNGWNGEYIPGTAWVSGLYYGDVYFKITFDSEYPLGVDDLGAESRTNIYPNPTNGLLHFNSSANITAVVVKDMSGKVVMTENGSNITQLNATALSKGMYMISLQNENGKTVSKRFARQ